MQTAGNCDFLHLQILKKQANLRFPLNVQNLDLFQLQVAVSLTSQPGPSCHLHIALLIPFHYFIPFMTFVQ